MGNSDSDLFDEIFQNEEPPPGRFVINFISVDGIPTFTDGIGNTIICDPYIKAYISENVPGTDDTAPPKPISDTVTTHKRMNCTSAKWDSYRDFHINPPPEAYLTVEVHHWEKDRGQDKEPIGHVNIPIEAFKDNRERQFKLEHHQVYHLHFTLSLCTVRFLFSLFSLVWK